MALTTSKEYPWTDLSKSTLSPYYKPGDVISTYPTDQYWVNTGERWASGSSTPVTVIGLDKQEEAALRETIACQKKEIEELKKALEVLIGVRGGESADTST